LHDTILSRSEVLLEVQKAEAEEEQTRRQLNVNNILLFLTGFTLVSVLADAYEFLKGDDEFIDWLKEPIARLKVLGAFVLILVIGLLLVQRVSIRGVRRHRRGLFRMWLVLAAIWSVTIAVLWGPFVYDMYDFEQNPFGKFDPVIKEAEPRGAFGIITEPRGSFEYLLRVIALAVLPPAVFLVLGAALAWAIAGFRAAPKR
jgi:hypothetical protein